MRDSIWLTMSASPCKVGVGAADFSACAGDAASDRATTAPEKVVAAEAEIFIVT